MRTFKYKIKHKETGLNLRAYIAKFKKIEVLNHYSGHPEKIDMSNEKVKIIVSENGSPGFYYYVPWEGAAVYWLGKKEWEVIFR